MVRLKRLVGLVFRLSVFLKRVIGIFIDKCYVRLSHPEVKLKAGNIYCRSDEMEDFSFEIPLRCDLPCKERLICAVIHIYYPDLCDEIIRYIQNVPGNLDVFISTTSYESRKSILDSFALYTKGTVEVRVFENRGRDIAPKIVGFSDVYDRYDYALSLHTKKSPHGGAPLESWRYYLYEHLLGSPDIVKSNLELLDFGSVGMVFPQHFYYLRNILDWGPNFDACYKILLRMGVTISRNVFLECPTGSMFWCRCEAMKGILSLGLSFDDFEVESGQVDGTLAHAIERVFLYALESRGYTWAKVSLPALYQLPSTIIPVEAFEDIKSGMFKVYRKLIIS